MRFFGWFFLAFLSFKSFAQLNFEFTWKGEKIELLHYYTLGEKDSIQFFDLKCYLSAIELHSKKNGKFKLNPPIHLIDAQVDSSFILANKIDCSLFQFITFTLGLDSITNTSGELDGDLDPVLGMYWAWNTGYIHYKFMGKASTVPTYSKTFEFHLGGYRKPKETYFKIELPLTSFTIQLDLYQLFNEKINLNLLHQLMIPGKTAHELSLVLQNSIRMK